MKYLMFIIGLTAGVWAADAPKPDPNFVNPLEKSKGQNDADVLVIMDAMVVEGKVEKPQVMMAITKEKPKFLTDKLSMDFTQPVLQPLEENTFKFNNAPPAEGK